MSILPKNDYSKSTTYHGKDAVSMLISLYNNDNLSEHESVILKSHNFLKFVTFAIKNFKNPSFAINEFMIEETQKRYDLIKNIDKLKRKVKKLMKGITKKNIDFSHNDINDFLKKEVLKNSSNGLLDEIINEANEYIYSLEFLIIDYDSKKIEKEQEKKINIKTVINEDKKESNPEDDLELIYGNYYKVEILGQGGFGIAYKAYDKINKTFVVIKESTDGEASINEIKNMERLKDQCHEFFACYYESFIIEVSGKKKYYIVMEYLKDYITLTEFIKKNNIEHESKMRDDIEMNFTKIQNIIKEMFLNLCNAVKSMHALGLAHLDLKPDNIMINAKTNKVKFIDFGVSCIEEECERMLGYTISYVDPIIYLRYTNLSYKKKKYLYRAQQGDLWSLGCILYFIASEKTPLENFILANPSLKNVVTKYMTEYDYKNDTEYQNLEDAFNILGISLNDLLTIKAERKLYC